MYWLTTLHRESDLILLGENNNQRKGKERKGKERKGKERRGKEGKGRDLGKCECGGGKKEGYKIE